MSSDEEKAFSQMMGVRVCDIDLNVISFLNALAHDTLARPPGIMVWGVMLQISFTVWRRNID